MSQIEKCVPKRINSDVEMSETVAFGTSTSQTEDCVIIDFIETTKKVDLSLAQKDAMMCKIRCKEFGQINSETEESKRVSNEKKKMDLPATNRNLQATRLEKTSNIDQNVKQALTAKNVPNFYFNRTKLSSFNVENNEIFRPTDEPVELVGEAQNQHEDFLYSTTNAETGVFKISAPKESMESDCRASQKDIASIVKAKQAKIPLNETPSKAERAEILAAQRKPMVEKFVRDVYAQAKTSNESSIEVKVPVPFYLLPKYTELFNKTTCCKDRESDIIQEQPKDLNLSASLSHKSPSTGNPPFAT